MRRLVAARVSRAPNRRILADAAPRQRLRRRKGPMIGFSVPRAAAALAATAILLGACGGDEGATGGTGSTLHVMVVNASAADVTISYTGAEPADDQTQATCSADTHDFPVSDPFTIAIDGKTV